MKESVSNSGRAPLKWALLIGIDEYPKLPPELHLKGCASDVEAIECLLTSEQFGFPAGNVLKLTSPAADSGRLATRENILAAFRRHLIENSNVGARDTIVIYYSGHGSQVPDEDFDEESGYDQTIVPCDGGLNRNRREEVLDITDDQISALLDELAERTHDINLFIDSCHSGGITRALQDAEGRDAEGRERYLPPATYEVVRRPTTEAAGAGTTTRGEAGSQPAPARGAHSPSGWLPLGHGHLVISACRSVERAREDRFFEFPWFKDYGILTYYLLKAMRNVGPETTFHDIWEDVKVNVTRRNRWQNPQIEGAFERKVFGGAALPRRRYFAVTSKDQDGVWLNAGAVHNATAGSRYAVYEEGTQVFEGDIGRLAVLRLTRVDAFKSLGQVLEGDAADVRVGAPAVEIEHDFGSMKRGVVVKGDEPITKDLRRLISQSPLLSLAEAGQQADVNVMLRNPYLPDGSEDTKAGSKLFILGRDGHPLVEPVEPDKRGVAAALERLHHLAQYQNMLDIDNPDPRSELKGKIKLRLLRRVRDGSGKETLLAAKRNAGGEIILKGGDRIALEIENTADVPVYVTLLDFSPRWRVQPFFPPPGAMDNLVAVGVRRRVKQKVNFPPELRQQPAGSPPPLEVVKLIATTDPVDFRSIWLPATRAARGKAAPSSLLRVVELAWGGSLRPVTRSLVRGTDPTVSDWATQQVAFHLEP